MKLLSVVVDIIVIGVIAYLLYGVYLFLEPPLSKMSKIIKEKKKRYAYRNNFEQKYSRLSNAQKKRLYYELVELQKVSIKSKKESDRIREIGKRIPEGDEYKEKRMDNIIQGMAAGMQFQLMHENIGNINRKYNIEILSKYITEDIKYLRQFIG